MTAKTAHLRFKFDNSSRFDEPEDLQAMIRVEFDLNRAQKLIFDSLN